jgi:ribosomal protein S18 acetylase RimI-like enzyme
MLADREQREAMRLLADSGSARTFLRQDVPLWAWPLCTLGAREWPYVRLWVDDLDRPEAGLWLFDHPSWGGSVQAFGPPPTLERMIPNARLPKRAFVRLLPDVRELVTARYRFDWLEPIVRMHVTPETLIEPEQARLVEPLGLEHAALLAALYAHWPESRFHSSRLRLGYQYVGIREGDRLVAVAEQVLRAREDALAVVQGVLVHPAWRGRGLAAAVTSVLTSKLFSEGAQDVVLDVRENNLPALAAYARIGYRRHVTLLAGPGSAR